MDDSFRVRVDKVFGSLTSTAPSSNLSSLWCLTDDEIHKREWDRDSPSRELLDFDSKPCPPHIDGFFAKPHLQTLDFPKQLQSDLEELSDGQEEPDADEPDIRSCIGLDSTLDYEEEEDEFDKVAVGREKQQPSDRLYLRDVSDYGIPTDTYNELPLTLEEVERDPRANHLAAKLRLQEDAAEAAALREAHFTSMPPPKVFRFNEDSNLPPDSSVPDYIRNPSKYTCYALDASDNMDEASNRKAYMDFFSLMKKRAQLEDDSATNFQKFPTFNPRMKQQEPAGPSTKQPAKAEQMQVRKAIPLSIIAVESDNAQVSALEEDEWYNASHRARPGSLQKHSRRYRTRAIMDIDDHSA
ncbi:uncharacterized protein [Nicotiana tomentosiformis]|uniref:uncharacterized protein n=1 Tax=Nicotiana tomentosiformis TaxID=4098 RepID=UPI00144776EF|nr:uncharacterized protein LOC117279304 [Nicotiana tomentosiformis]